MTGIPPQQDPMLRLRYYKETGQSELAQKYEQYLRETGQLKETGGSDIHAQYRSGALQKRMEGANARDAANLREQQETDQESYGNKVAGGIASFAKHVPGAEMAQAGARALMRRQPYREALSDIQGAEDASGGVGTANSLTGAALAALAMQGGKVAGKIIPKVPGGAIGQGAAFGGASGALTSDPDADRVTGGILGTIIGGGLGASGKLVSKVPGLKGVSKAISGKASNAMNAMRVRGVGGMDILPEAPTVIPKPPTPPASPPPRPTPPSPRPSSGPPAGARPGHPIWQGNAPRPASVPEPPPQASNDLTAKLEALLNRIRGQQPQELGNTIGDAEAAQFPHAQDDLMDLIERSKGLPRRSPTKGQARGPKP